MQYPRLDRRLHLRHERGRADVCGNRRIRRHERHRAGDVRVARE